MRLLTQALDLVKDISTYDIPPDTDTLDADNPCIWRNQLNGTWFHRVELPFPFLFLALLTK